MVPGMFKPLKLYCTVIILNGKVWFYNAVMHLKDAIGMANSVDSDQTAPKQSDLKEQSNLAVLCLLRHDCPSILNFYGTYSLGQSSRFTYVDYKFLKLLRMEGCLKSNYTLANCVWGGILF